MFLPLVYFLSVPVILLILVLYIFALAWKSIVWVLLKAKHGKSAHMLPGVDAISQFPLLKVNEAANNVMIRIGGPVTLDEIREKFRAKLVELKRSDGSWQHPKLRQYFVEFMGYQVSLPDPEFKFDPHFDYYYDCRETPVTYRDEDDLGIILEDLINRPIWERDTMAPWRIFLLPRRDNREHVVLVRADHAIFDAGAAAMVLFPTITDDAADVELFRNMAHVPVWLRFINHLRGLMIIPFGTLMQFFSEPDFNPIHRHDREAKAGKFIAFPKLIPLYRLNEIRNLTDVKINSIILTCVSRAVSKFTESKFGTTERAKWTFTCHQPVSMWMPGDSMELINRISAVATPLPQTPAPVPNFPVLDHLKMIKTHVGQVFATDAIWSGYTFLKFGINTFPKFLTVPLANKSFTHPTLGLSNIKGSEKAYTAFGHPVTLMSGFLPLIKTWDLGIVVTSYSGDMAVSVTGRKSAFATSDEIKTIQTYILEEVDSLHRACKLAAHADATQGKLEPV